MNVFINYEMEIFLRKSPGLNWEIKIYNLRGPFPVAKQSALATARRKINTGNEKREKKFFSFDLSLDTLLDIYECVAKQKWVFLICEEKH